MSYLNISRRSQYSCTFERLLFSAINATHSCLLVVQLMLDKQQIFVKEAIGLTLTPSLYQQGVVMPHICLKYMMFRVDFHPYLI